MLRLITLALVATATGLYLHAADLKPLSPEQWESIHKMVLPHDGELNWAAVPWQTSITLARHQAAVNDKPLCVFADTGAGFADALGLC
jgi:hypothetical protein